MPFTYRQNEILELLKEKKHAKISDISKSIFVSDATVRRELTELEKLGLVKRDHGGAVILESADEISIFVRQKIDTIEKEATAQIAVGKLPDFKTVFIDNSSTAFIYSTRLNLNFKSVVTNGLMLAGELSTKKDVNITILGGQYDYNTTSTTGPVAVRTLRELRFDLCICSCAAIDLNGVYEGSVHQSAIKQEAMKYSAHKILLVDRTKFNTNAMYCTSYAHDFDAIFTNADDKTLEPYRALEGVNIINK